MSLLLIVGIIIFVVGLLQLPLLVDLIRSFKPSAIPKRLAGHVIDAVIVTLMTGLFFVAFHSYWYYFLPAHMMGDPWATNAGLYHIAFFWFLYLNTICNYVCAVFTEPGNPPKMTIMPDKAMAISLESCIPKEKVCATCKCVKAQSTHHCTVCGKCVLHMDHHCPFVKNCVGLNNFHYFYCMINYLWLGLIYSFHLTARPFLQCHGWNNEHPNIVYDCGVVGTLSILSFPIGLNLVGGGGAVISNALLLLANRSTLGCLKEVMKGGLTTITEGIKDINIRNLWNPRSRVNVVLLSKRKHLVYFLIPPVYTSGRLLFSYCCKKKDSMNLGTLRFDFKFPKNGQAQA